MTGRRQFLGRTAAAVGVLSLRPAHALALRLEGDLALTAWLRTLPPSAGAPEDEAFWARVRAAYDSIPTS